MKHILSSMALLGLCATFGSAAAAADIDACLITKTDSNPFFVSAVLITP